MQLLSHTDDDVLLALMKESEDTALAAIYKKYWQKLYLAANAILKDGQACEDIIQEIFINLWNNRRELYISVSLNAYLSAAVRYEVYRQIKSGRVRKNIFVQIINRVNTGNDYKNLEYKELHSQVSAIVAQLPVKCKAVYKLSREEHLSHKQIAALLNISTKTVENHLTKALSFLRVSLGPLLL